jgi:hypothetical protein
MTKDTLYVGLDTDKKWIDISVAEPLPGGEVRYFGKIANRAASLDRVIKRLGKEARACRVLRGRPLRLRHPSSAGRQAGRELSGDRTGSRPTGATA